MLKPRGRLGIPKQEKRKLDPEPCLYIVPFLGLLWILDLEPCLYIVPFLGLVMDVG